MRYKRIVVLAALIINIVIVFWAWWSISGAHTGKLSLALIALGRLTGLLCTLAVLANVVIMARLPIIERNFELQTIAEFHRLNGYFIICSLIAHLFYLLFGYGILQHLNLWDQFVVFNSQFSDVLWASIGSALFVGVAASSVMIARRRLPYQVWYWVHLSVYVAVLLTFWHQVKVGGDFIGHPLFADYWYVLYISAFAMLAWYRFLRPIWQSWRHGFRVSEIRQEATDTYSIIITGKNLSSFHFTGGQYANWWFLAPGVWFESHPFSFSSDPSQSFLRVTFKIAGDYTQRLTTIRPGTKVIIDGPRGSFTAERAMTKTVLLIAGGIGSAPMISLLPELKTANHDIALLYAVRQPEFAAFKEELSEYNTSYIISSKNQRIDKELLSSYLKIPALSTVYVCGPPAMNDSVITLLKEIGVPGNQIVCERFNF
jgi:predicted ferric reductase